MTEPSVLTNVTAMGTVVWTLQELKKSGWCKALTMDTAQLNRIVSALAAIATGAAIHVDWNSATSTLTISGLTTMAVLTFLWHAYIQFVGQELLYQAVYAPKQELKQAAELVNYKTAVVAETATAQVVDAVHDVQETVAKTPLKPSNR